MDSLYARTTDEEWVCATEIEINRGLQYFCDCPDRHRMKLVKASGNPDKRHFRDYFAHVSTGHKRNREQDLIQTCSPGGESIEHRNAKHRLREMAGNFTYVSKRCKLCKTDVIEDCSRASITIEVQSRDKKWRYDCILVKDDIRIAALEIFHKHATTQDKILATRKDGLKIAEFRAEDVNDMQRGAHLENLCPEIFTCHGCLIKISKSWILQCYIDERNEWMKQDRLVYDAYIKSYNEGETKKINERTAKQQYILQQMSSYTEERSQWLYIDKVIENEYWRPKIYFYSVFHPSGYPAPYEMICSTRKPIGETYGDYAQHRQRKQLEAQQI